MIDLSKELDFKEFIEKNPAIEKFINQAAKEFYEELPPEEKFKKPYLEKDFQEYVIVCGLPSVDKAKFPTLQKYFVQRIIPKLGLDTDMRNDPMQPRLWGWDDAKENTNGCLILDFKSAQLAEYAVSGTPGDSKKVGLTGLVFDKKHTLTAFLYSDYQKVFNSPDTFTAPVVLEDKQLVEWQNDNEEHYAYQNGDRVYFNKIFHLSKKPVNVLGKDDAYLQLNGVNRIEWSRSGRYLIEFLEEGFQLYGGNNMQKLNFFYHKNVQNVEFSPKEDYVLSYNGNILQAEDSDNYIVWNVNEVSRIRTFKSAQDDKWGGMKFNHDGTLIARVTSHQLHVYKLPEMKILPQAGTDERTPILVRNIQDFTWVKNQNWIVTASYAGEREFDPSEIARTPTKLALYELPSRKEVKWKSISMDICSIDFFSEATGKYVVAVMQKIKNKKIVSTLVHVANLYKRNPIEITDFEFLAVEEGALKSVSFEETSGKLALVTQVRQLIETKVKKYEFNINLFDISCRVANNKCNLKVEQIPTIPIKKTPEVQWSTNGTFFALVNKDKESSQQGILEIGFLSKNKDKKFQQEIFKKYDNLSYMTYAGWDSTGRVILTGSENTNSYHIYNGLGEQLYKETVNKEGLQFLQFRPRANIFITAQQKDKIHNDIKPNNTVWNKWQQEDEKIINKEAWEEEQRKVRQEQEFKQFLQNKRKLWNDTRAERVKLVGVDVEYTRDHVEVQVYEREEIIETGVVEN